MSILPSLGFGVRPDERPARRRRRRGDLMRRVQAGEPFEEIRAQGMEPPR